jgi:hypothetical protein
VEPAGPCIGEVGKPIAADRAAWVLFGHVLLADAKQAKQYQRQGMARGAGCPTGTFWFRGGVSLLFSSIQECRSRDAIIYTWLAPNLSYRCLPTMHPGGSLFSMQAVPSTVPCGRMQPLASFA